MRAFFRVEKGPSVGLGHVMRCTALAETLRAEGAAVTFVDAESTAGTRADADETCTRIAATANAEANANTEPTWLVVDGYSFRAEYMQWVRAGLSHVRLAYIDDKREEMPYDLVLRGHLHFAPVHARGELAGPAYALLRARIVEAAHARAKTAPAQRRALLVTLGGADAAGHTERTLDALALVAPGDMDERSIVVCVGRDNPRAASIEARARALPHHAAVRVGVDLADVLGACELALTAAGTTTLELACAGIAALTWPVADNQVPVAAAAAALGVARALAANTAAPDAAAVAMEIGAFLRDTTAHAAMAARGPALVDGRGAERVARALTMFGV